ncbi:MAG: hypothetical protein U9N84_02570 [Actinomycetota bacterium]|nr:hypothetical protein [Actinomycetota bacterium]
MTHQDFDRRAIGWTWFAAVMMWLNGLFHVFAGLVGVFTDEFYPDAPEYLFRFNDETWGWIHLVTGLVVFTAGVALLTAKPWARVVAVVMVSLSMLETFAWVPTYPVWSIIILSIGASVIWALTVHGHDIESIPAN